jgi:CheY-like chemotaxis protein
VTLPRVEAPVSAEEQARSAAAPSRRILIVDDNADAATTLSELLKMDGHQTQPAFSAEEALELAQSFVPDVVLLDIGLPRMDGYEVARRLRHSLLRKGARLIALTGYGQAEDRERAHAAGFDAHLVKPVDLEVLTKLLGAR